MNHRLEFFLSPLLLLTIAALIATTYRTNAQLKSAKSFGAERRGRLIENHSYSDSPVKIIDVRIGKKKVTFKESFDDDDDWLKGLTIAVENQSKVAVNHVGIDFLLERPREQMGEVPAFWNLTYGSNPFWLKPQEPPMSIQPIQPGETKEIRLQDEAYKEMRLFLRKVGYSASGETVKVMISTIGFINGTAWRGLLYRRDPAASDGWTGEEKPQASR